MNDRKSAGHTRPDRWGCLKRNALVFLAVLSVTVSACAQESRESYVYVPATVSKEWQDYLPTLPDPNRWSPKFPMAGDIGGWEKLDKSNEIHKEVNDRVLRVYEPQITPRKLGGVPVLDIKPRNWKRSAKILIYTHGGSYTFGSAQSSLANAVLVADATGLRVVSVDYTVAPRARWQQITDEVVAVFEALREEGHPLKYIAIHGTSAGGGLAAGAVLKMRDQGIGMPAAAVLWSPWSDITETGDTYMTLKAADPDLVYGKTLKASAAAYADPKDQKNPYVSPVYGDYTKGFPPTLIQGGTKEIFLSNFIRQYQAIEAAGQTAKLDLYEGMIHVFQLRLPESPESQLALTKVKNFLDQYLGK